MSHHPIGDLGFLSDCHSAALVDKSGSIDWWCLPSFSSPSVFARLLDPNGGHFRVGPPDADPVERRYLDDSLVLSTTFRTPTGTLELTDALAMREGARGHDLGVESPHILLRQARCTEGRVTLEVDFTPRFEYGLTTPILRVVDGGVVASGGPATLCLSSSLDLTVEGAQARGQVTLVEGEEAMFALEGVSTWGPLPNAWHTTEVAARLADTCEAWHSWTIGHQAYEGPYEEAVRLGARVLQGLMFRPTGALIAAATTSLPEAVGGERNWDYRYAWVRDASLILHALWAAGCVDEARDFLGYLTTAASSIYVRDQIQIVFGIRGERDLTERTLPWLSGWRDSRPVRVGNAAWTQRQADVYGELLDAVYLYRDVIAALPEQQRRFLIILAERAAAGWDQPDQGIWEMRDEPRHFVHSKLMSWLALERAIELAPLLGADDRVERWSDTRATIRDVIERDGWSAEAGAFTQAFGSNDLDASCLLIPITGFLPAHDARVTATIDAIEERLTDERGLVLRYRSDDGLHGTEGSFLLCTFWLAEAQAMAGRVERARATFERAASYANDLGLLSEEVDSETGELMGNFPQAFSHVGLINAASALARALSRSPDVAPRDAHAPTTGFL